MKTPITYYGGKQKLASKILKLIPEHNLYCEPFIGGAAVFFAKEPSRVEVINDNNAELMNFYKVVQNDFISLEKYIRITLHSRKSYREATVIYENSDMFNEIQRAWAIWCLANQSFSSKFNGGWGYDVTANSMSKKVSNKRASFTEDYAIRLQNVQIECTDALRIIRSRDSAQAFFYCDPPYFNSDCGHYDGYSIDDFEMLLKTLSKIEGKFLLSSYPSPLLKQYAANHGWHQLEFKQTVSITGKRPEPKIKTEVLTANYPLSLPE